MDMENHVNDHVNDFVTMFFLMMVSGLLSTMNVWASKWSDIKWSLNDIYMSLLMTGWMFLLMGLYYKDSAQMIIGAFVVITSFGAIRFQFMINEDQYIRGMIPHHSMAVHMSNKLIENNPDVNVSIKRFAKNIIAGQENEIIFMKNILNSNDQFDDQSSQ